MNNKDILKYIAENTDKYFTYSKIIANKYGDTTVIYAVFIRQPSMYACNLALSLVINLAEKLNQKIKIYENFSEGELVGAGEPLFFLEGSYAFLSEMETLLLQKVGIPCLSAWYAYMMSCSLPNAAFISMVARHSANNDMVYMIEYGASIGSKVSLRKGSKGFVGCSTDHCASLFNQTQGFGSMPHALIGYAGSTLKAAQMYQSTINSAPLTILVDYFRKEITDSLEVCNYFAKLASSGDLLVRIDTHAGRFVEGLDAQKSYEILEQYAPEEYSYYRNNYELDALVGTGVSAAAIFYLRQELDKHGFSNVKIIVSSGFNLFKCQMMSAVGAPIDYVGTGAILPKEWSDTYATADIIKYGDRLSVKYGREFLIKKWLQSTNA